MNTEGATLNPYPSAPPAPSFSPGAIGVLERSLASARASAETLRQTDEHYTKLRNEARGKRLRYEQSALELEDAIRQLGGSVEEVAT